MHSSEEIQEIERLQKTIRQLEGILKTSRNSEQRGRVAKDLRKAQTRLEELAPDGLPASAPAATAGGGQAAPAQPEVEEYEMISKFTPRKASPHSEDKDINFLSTMMEVFEGEFWPALGESQLKLDFSHSAERDSFYTHLEESKRNLKILTETIEEYATVTNADFREQLYKMKNKQSRVYLYDSVKTLKKIREFLKKLVTDIQAGGNIIMNKDDSIHFNPELHSATLLNHVTIANAVGMIYQFVDETIRELNLPDLDTN